MAEKKKKRKKGNIGLFIAVFFLVLLAGSVGLVGYWALADGEIPAIFSQKAEAEPESVQPETEYGMESAEVLPEETKIPESIPEETVEEPKARYDDLLADEEYCRQNKIYAKETTNPEEVTLVFGGDILFDDNYAVMVRMNARGQGVEGSISEEMLQVMRDADICMLNNEFTYTDRGAPTPNKKFTFRARPEYASYLQDMGVDIVSLANNHAYDYGEVSLTDTIDTLNAIEMPFVGAGYDLEEAVKPVTFVANDMRIAILSATQIERYANSDTPGATEESPGVFRCLDVSRLLEEIRKAREENDFVIVYVHWGTENVDQPDWSQLEQAPLIAEAGADLIIGDHPHVLQGITYQGDIPVFYSMGNYLFSSKTQDTCLVEVRLDENGLKSLQFIPGKQEGCSVYMHHDEEKERVLSYMRELSPGVIITEDGYVYKAE